MTESSQLKTDLAAPSEQVDILIIGGGPSGSVAASIAQRHGYKVKVVERSKFPRFVIGESLLPKCMEHLEEAGFLDVLKAQNYQKKFGARFLKADESCLFDFSEQYTDGWTWTWQVPRGHFDKVLIDEVQKMGVEVAFETSVTNVEFDGTHSRTTVQHKDGSTGYIDAKYIIDASGYGRVLPRLLGLEKRSTMPPRKAIFSHIQDHHRPEGSPGQQITFVIHEVDVWMWIIPFSNGITSIGFVGNPEFFDRFEGTPDEQIKDMVLGVYQMKDRFQDQDLVMDTRIHEAFAVSATQLFGPGYVITGNSSEFIDPVFSSGVTFATQSGLMAAKMVCQELAGETVDWQRDYTDYLKEGTETFRTYVHRWYDGSLQDIFFYTSDSSLQEANAKIKRQICSVLAGYVWDETNPFVKKQEKALSALVKVISL